MVFTFFDSSFSEPVYISLRPASMAVSIGDYGLSFDGAGRLLTASFEGHLFRRGLNHRFLDKWRSSGGRKTRDLDSRASDLLVLRVRDILTQLTALLPTETPEAIGTRLDEAAGWDLKAYAEDRERFLTIYQPIGILPPDQYMALVLQATEGCHYNQCTFCQFYQNVPFRIKDELEFRRHIDFAGQFVGTGLRRTLFLADANALAAPHPRLLRFFDAINETFDVAPHTLSGCGLTQWKRDFPEGMTGIYSFMDAFTGTKKTEDEWASLARRGLKQIYIGMESGHVPLLQFLKKPSLPENVRALVQTAKAAGIHVGVIIIIGIGGHHYADGHISDTISAVNSLALTSDDLLYFSNFVETPGSEYAVLAKNARIIPLTETEMQEQIDTIRDGLHLDGDPRISIYDLNEFIY